ncbi:MAG: glycosyltransferase [Bryobacterales bacterium]
MRLALVSPLPPARTGVAEFSARLAEELERFAQVDSMQQSEPARLREYDRRLYQIGNNPLHTGAYEAALAVPGVVELHDAVLQHFLLGRLTRDEYVEEFVYNADEWSRELAGELWDRRAQSAADEAYFRYPMLRRVVGSASAVIVHNPGAARRVRDAIAESAPVFTIPHFVELEAEHPADARSGFEIAPDVLLIGCFGFQRPTRRLRSVLRAAVRLSVPWRLLVVGEFVSPDYEASLADLLGHPNVIRKPYVPMHEWMQLAAAVDVCVNLRWPSAGETSGVAMRMMALSKPVIVTDSEEWADIPDGAVLRIDSGEPEEDELVELLELLAREPDMRAASGAAARRHLEQRHSLAAVMPLYRRALTLD